MSKTKNLEVALELSKQKLQVAEKALNDIVRWDDPGSRASRCLEKLALLDGF